MRTSTKKDKIYFNIILYFVFLYTLFFGVFAILKGNYEYIYISFVFFALLLLIRFINKRLDLPNAIVFGIAIGGLLHMLGGNVYIHGTRLYDVSLWLIHMDNVIHTYNAFIMTLLVFNLLEPYLHKTVKENRFLTGLIIVLITAGLGSIAEIIELISVLFFNAAKDVGNYLNNAFDLVFNLLGAILGSIAISIYRGRKMTKK